MGDLQIPSEMTIVKKENDYSIRVDTTQEKARILANDLFNKKYIIQVIALPKQNCSIIKFDTEFHMQEALTKLKGALQEKRTASRHSTENSSSPSSPSSRSSKQSFSPTRSLQARTRTITPATPLGSKRASSPARNPQAKTPTSKPAILPERKTSRPSSPVFKRTSSSLRTSRSRTQPTKPITPPERKTNLPLNADVCLTWIFLSQMLQQGNQWANESEHTWIARHAISYLRNPEKHGISDLQVTTRLQELTSNQPLSRDALLELFSLFVMHDILGKERWQLTDWDKEVEGFYQATTGKNISGLGRLPLELRDPSEFPAHQALYELTRRLATSPTV